MSITEIQRDRWGRPLIIPPEGGKPVAYTRCTTFVGAIEDTWNLTKWKQRLTAAGIAARKDLHLRAASLGTQPDDPVEAKRWKREMNDLCEAAMEAVGSSSAATIGTSLHTFTELMDRGLAVDPPADFAHHIDNYRRAMAGYEQVAVEQFLVRDDLRIGGTADRLLREKATGRLIIGDLKTGSVDYPHKIAMQLATYANSLIYDAATGQRTPLGDVDLDTALIIHLDAKTGDCRLYWVDIESGWEAVKLAAQVRTWRNRTGLTVPVPDEDMAAATVQQILVTPDPVASAIGAATTIDQLVALRQASAATWTDQHTDLLVERVGQLSATGISQ